MRPNNAITAFLSQYDGQVFQLALELRKVILTMLPGVSEQLDAPAKMVAYGYGQKYAELVCVMIPSKKGLKLGFNRGADLPDPDGLLEGTGKISRYVVIASEDVIQSPELKKLLESALAAYRQRVAGK